MLEPAARKARRTATSSTASPSAFPASAVTSASCSRRPFAFRPSVRRSQGGKPPSKDVIQYHYDISSTAQPTGATRTAEVSVRAAIHTTPRRTRAHTSALATTARHVSRVGNLGDSAPPPLRGLHFRSTADNGSAKPHIILISTAQPHNRTTTQRSHTHCRARARHHHRHPALCMFRSLIHLHMTTVQLTTPNRTCDW